MSNDWQNEKQLKVLNEKREERVVDVLRETEEQTINMGNVVVGDIVLFEPGEAILCDSAFLPGHNIRYDWRVGCNQEASLPQVREKRLAEIDPDSSVGDAESISSSRRNVSVSGWIYLDTWTPL